MAQRALEAREQFKAERAAAVRAITVTTAAGNTFDGDETSQDRMVRAIVALQATGTPSVVWVLADNSTVQATAAELVEALALAGAAQAALWVAP
jgi:biopolymer transport protein ExbD